MSRPKIAPSMSPYLWTMSQEVRSSEPVMETSRATSKKSLRNIAMDSIGSVRHVVVRHLVNDAESSARPRKSERSLHDESERPKIKATANAMTADRDPVRVSTKLHMSNRIPLLVRIAKTRRSTAYHSPFFLTSS